MGRHGWILALALVASVLLAPSQRVSDHELASPYAGTGACPAGQAVTALNRADDPTCAGLSYFASSSSDLRSALSDETGTGAAMFGITAAAGDELGASGLQAIRRNAGDTAWEAFTPVETVGPRQGVWTTFGLVGCGDATVYMGFGGVENCNATEANVETTLSLASAITVTGLSCQQTTDASCGMRATVRQNQASPGAPDLQCSMTNVDGCADTGSTAFATGDEIAVLLEDTGANCSSDVSVTCRVFFTF